MSKNVRPRNRVQPVNLQSHARSYSLSRSRNLPFAIKDDEHFNGSSTVGVQFPKHLATPVCEFLITGGGYFDFKGRSGLIKTLKNNIPAGHYLVTVISDATYTNALERLSALRNFAAHESEQSRSIALKAIGASNLASSGSWLRVNNRFGKISNDLTALAKAVEAAAPL